MNTLRFQLFGFATEIQQGFLLLGGVYILLGLGQGAPLWASLSFIAVVFVSILVHELGHAFAIRHYGYRVGRIALHGFGGDVNGMPADSPPKRRFVIAVAGPGAGFALGALTYALSASSILPGTAFFNTLVWQLLWVNVLWSIFNLLPMLPLDGGNALAAVLELRFGGYRSWRYAYMAGIVTGIGVAVLALLWNEPFAMLIGGFCAYHNYQRYQMFQRGGYYRF